VAAGEAPAGSGGKDCFCRGIAQAAEETGHQ
jgi:hypothetical protein